MKEYFDKVAVSNSDMKNINPEQGGTPAKYKKYVIDGEKEQMESPSLENGKLIHLYVEDPGKFVVSDVERPTDTLAEWIEEVFSKVGPDHIDKESSLLREVILDCRDGRYGKMKEETVLAKFYDRLDYMEHLALATNELCMTGKQKELVAKCTDSLRANKLASKLLFEEGDTFGDVEYNELPVYWEEKVPVYGETDEANGEEVVKQTLKCKALIDRLQVSPTNKRAVLTDLKTTGKPISLFPGSFKYYRYGRQVSWYLLAVCRFLEEQYPDIPVEDWALEANIVAVETTGLYETKVFGVTPEVTDKGMSEYKDCVERIAYATYHNEWVQTREEVAQDGYIHLTIEDYE